MKIAIIGCGKQAHKHVQGFKQVEGLQHIALADIDPLRALKLGRELGLPAYSTVEEALADPTVDSVVICTPTPSHGPLMAAAVQAGKHVLCEKPFCDTVETAAMLGKTIESTSKIVRIGYIYRFSPALNALRGILEGAPIDGTSRELGKIQAATFRLSGPGSHALWKHRRDSGGGVVNEMTSHMIDLSLWLFGPVDACDVLVKAQVQPRRHIQGEIHPVDAEDYVDVRLTSRSGVEIRVSCDFVTTRFAQSVEVAGENGFIRASIDPTVPSICHVSRERNGPADIRRLGADGADLYGLQSRDFAAQCRGEPGIGCTPAEAAEGMNILQAIATVPIVRVGAAG